VAYVTADGHVHELYVRLGEAWAHADLTAIAGAPSAPGSTLAGYGWKGGSSKQVVFLTGDGQVHELWVRRNGTWAHADLTQITGAPAAAGSPISAYSWYTGGSKQAIYLTADGHVHEMFV
jgi:hypothetical protein